MAEWVCEGEGADLGGFPMGRGDSSPRVTGLTQVGQVPSAGCAGVMGAGQGAREMIAAAGLAEGSPSQGLSEQGPERCTPFSGLL